MSVLSRPKSLADVAFEHLDDALENEDLSDTETIAFFAQIVELAEQEIAEIEDDLEDEDSDDDEDD